MKNLIYKSIASLFLMYSGVLYSQSPVPCSSGTLFDPDEGDFITVPNTTYINSYSNSLPVENRTFEFWFKAVNVSNKQVIYKEGGSTNAYNIYLDGGRLYLGAYNGSPAIRRFFRSGTLQAETWYHVAFTQSLTEFKWYLNGEEQDTAPAFVVKKHTGAIRLARSRSNLNYPLATATWTPPDPADPLDPTGPQQTDSGLETINDSGLNPDYDFTGNIALFRIWNVARSDSEINNFKSSLLTSGTSLVAYLDQGTINYQADGDTSPESTVSLNEDIKLQYFPIPSTNTINLYDVTDRTIEFRFTADDMTTRQVLYEEGGNVRAFVIFIEGGRLYLGAYRASASDGNRRFFRSEVGDVVANQEYHVALTLSGGNTLKWFLNGVEKDSQLGSEVDEHSGDINVGRRGDALQFPSDLTDVSTDWTASSVVGSASQTYDAATTQDNGSDNYIFSGTISLFRLWNTARSQTEINTNQSTLINASNLPPTSEKLVAAQDGFQLGYDSNQSDFLDGADDIIDAVTEVKVVEYTWNGASSSTWADASNWVSNPSQGVAPVPSRTQNITLQDGGTDPILTTAINVGSLTINPGVDLVINSGATLNVYYNFENNGTVTVKDGGSLIYHNCDSAITGSGTFDIQKTMRIYDDNYFYSYLSSPLIEANSIPSVLFPDVNVIYYFNSNTVGVGDGADWDSNVVNFKPGTGYAVRSNSTGGQARSFQGKINEGSIVVNVYYNSNLASTDVDNEWSTEGDNLVGNPYASALLWDKVIADEDNSEIGGTIYYWNQTSTSAGSDNNVNEYIQYNLTGGTTGGATGNIASGQGFFIKMIDPATSGATDTNATITFKPTHQINGANTVLYRGNGAKDKVTKNSKKQNRSWFTFSRGNQVNTLLVGFLEGATNQFDRLYDASFDTSEESLAFYSLVKKKYKASIQGLPPLKRDKKVVRLGFAVDQIGEHTIAIQEEHIDPEYYIYLRDREKKVTVDLRQRSYTFSIDSVGENNTRFKLIYTKKKRKATTSSKDADPTVTEIDSGDFSVYVDEVKDLIIEYDYDQDNIKEANLYTIRGQRIQRFDGKSNSSVAGLKTGIYIIEATLIDNRKRIKKLVIAN